MQKPPPASGNRVVFCKTHMFGHSDKYVLAANMLIVHQVRILSILSAGHVAGDPLCKNRHQPAAIALHHRVEGSNESLIELYADDIVTIAESLDKQLVKVET